jgi:hypothetical protein
MNLSRLHDRIGVVLAWYPFEEWDNGYDPWFVTPEERVSRPAYLFAWLLNTLYLVLRAATQRRIRPKWGSYEQHQRNLAAEMNRRADALKACPEGVAVAGEG